MGSFHGSSYPQIRQDTPKALVLAYWRSAMHAVTPRLVIPAALAAYLQLGLLFVFLGPNAAARAAISACAWSHALIYRAVCAAHHNES